MAIYRCAIQTISRAAGRSATAAAAYRAGERIDDARTEKTHDYTRKRDVESSAVIMPNGVSALTRAELWNRAEAAEKRRNATVAREALVAIPHELDRRARTELAHQYAHWLADTYGVAADVCVHRPHADRRNNQDSPGGDPRNYQAHILFTTRRIGQDGQLGAKTRILDEKQTGRGEVQRMRQQWEILCNQALERAGRPERVDCRSLRNQGIDHRAPQVKLGPSAAAVLRHGAALTDGVAAAKWAYNQAQAAKARTPPAAGRAAMPRTPPPSYQPKPPTAHQPPPPKDERDERLVAEEKWQQAQAQEPPPADMEEAIRRARRAASIKFHADMARRGEPAAPVGTAKENAALEAAADAAADAWLAARRQAQAQERPQAAAKPQEPPQQPQAPPRENRAPAASTAPQEDILARRREQVKRDLAENLARARRSPKGRDDDRGR